MSKLYHGTLTRFDKLLLVVVGILLGMFVLSLVGCAGVQMPPDEPNPCMPPSGVVLERDIPGCRVGSLLDTAEAKVGRGESVIQECAEMHLLIPNVPEPGDRIFLWAMLAKVEGDAGLFCEGTVARAYADAKLMREERDQRGARNFVRGVERECQGSRGLRMVVFPQ